MRGGAFDTTDAALRAQRLERLAISIFPALQLYVRQWSDSPEDIVQEALIELARQQAWPYDPVAWLYSVARNRAISELRAKSRRRDREAQVAHDRDSWFTSSNGQALDCQAAADALRGLPADQ